MNCRPTAVLIDCSELELGRHLGQQGKRGRPDDHMEAYKRRLHVYRQNTMPMFKSLDEQNRLRIVNLELKLKILPLKEDFTYRLMVIWKKSKSLRS